MRAITQSRSFHTFSTEHSPRTLYFMFLLTMFDLMNCQLNTAIVWPYLTIIFYPLLAPEAQKGEDMNRRASVI